MYIIEQNSKIPLHIQLYEELKKDIINNYQINDKLPSIRKVSALYNLSKNTVESAYKQLYAEGYIESYPKSGYFVSDLNYKEFDKKEEIKEKEEKKQKEYLYDFFPARVAKESFPLKLWKRLTNKVLDESLDFGVYPKGRGEEDLCEQIAKYLIRSRGAKCESSQIIITSGFAESMRLLALIIKDKHKNFAIENPGYHVAKEVLDECDFFVDLISVNNQGLVLDELKKTNSKIVYITPSHQYPKGVTMPIPNRQKLLSWSKEIDGLIVEDDYDSELSYYNRPIPCLQGLDNYDRVVYLGTFAKALSPALRVSYMVLPRHLLAKYESLLDSYFSKVSISTQKTLALFMKEGYYDKHIRKMRTLNKKKHEHLKSLLEKYLGDTMKIEAEGAGLAILINPKGDFDWHLLKSLAEQNSLKLYFAKDVSGGSWQAIRMGFGGFDEESLNQAIKLFAQIWHQCLK